jgi:hypothetical protein
MIRKLSVRSLVGAAIIAAALATLAVVMPVNQGGVAQAQAGTIIGGNKPPAGGGFGSFVYGGGSFADLVTASGCPQESAAYFYNKPNGSFAVYIPGTQVSIVNQDIMGLFPNDSIPLGTIFLGRCV